MGVHQRQLAGRDLTLNGRGSVYWINAAVLERIDAKRASVRQILFEFRLRAEIAPVAHSPARPLEHIQSRAPWKAEQLELVAHLPPSIIPSFGLDFGCGNSSPHNSLQK
jgi:hypothetical protein